MIKVYAILILHALSGDAMLQAFTKEMKNRGGGTI